MILAKSEPPETLETHTKNVLEVFRSIRLMYSDVLDICGNKRFWEILFLSLLLHDFGKGASGFQESIVSGGSWGYRHEILSAGFVSFLNLPDNERDAIGLAIITHHRDVLELRMKYSTKNPEGFRKYQECIQEMEPAFPELKRIFSKIPEWSLEYLGYEIVSFELPSLDCLQDVYKTVVTKYYRGYEEPNERTQLHGKLGIFLKGFLTACDHLASAHRFKVLPFPELKGRIQGMFKELNYVQALASNTSKDTMLIAPTGSGKTEASLLWADNNQNKERGRKLFYFLPYTASINALHKRFRNRIFDQPEYVGVEHGKASYYLYKTFGENDDYLTRARVVREIQSLTRKIYRPLKILTVFQLLKAFFGLKGFEQQLSEIVKGLIVVDEVHAYDVRTSALMLSMFRMMKYEFGCSFLIMSATIPSFLSEIYKEKLSIENEIKLPEEKLKSMIRHHVTIFDGTIMDCEERVIQSLDSGKRVLIICNTVERSREVFRTLRAHAKNPMLIHGRFTLEDRENKEEKLIMSEDGPGITDSEIHIDLLVGTQVIEVSLDIDYDVLFSEPAPIDALIQRFGRVNRKPGVNRDLENVYIARKGSDKDHYIYKDRERVDKTLNLLERKHRISEFDVQEIIDEVYVDGYTAKEKELFESIQKQFTYFRNKVVPFIESSDRGEFYDMFDSVEVVPFKFIEKHQELINEKKYLEAMKYAVKLSGRQYRWLLNQGSIEKLENQSYVSTNYDPEIGLDLNDNGEAMGIYNEFP